MHNSLSSSAEKIQNRV